MCHCITPHALISGLLLRIERDGYEPTRSDARGLLGSGCRVEDIVAAAEARVGPDRAARLRALLDAATR